MRCVVFIINYKECIRSMKSYAIMDYIDLKCFAFFLGLFF